VAAVNGDVACPVTREISPLSAEQLARCPGEKEKHGQKKGRGLRIQGWVRQDDIPKFYRTQETRLRIEGRGTEAGSKSGRGGTNKEVRC